MPIKPSDIKVGSCYVTPTKQVRRVLEINESGVKYEARGKTLKQKVNEPWATHVPSGLDTFAEAVEKEVRCDYDPDFSK